jgi:hypothetical protein
MTKQEDRARDNSARAFETLRESLTKIGWDPQPTKEEGELRIDFESQEIAVEDATAKIVYDFERFLFYLNFRKRTPKSRRSEVAEFMVRVNAELLLGSFDMHYEVGAIRFRAGVDFTQVELSDLLIRNAILSSMDVVEHYAPYLESVISGGHTPRAAFKAADAELG